MKYFYRLIIAILLILLTGGGVWAAGTVVETQVITVEEQHVEIVLTATGDAADGSVPDHTIGNLKNIDDKFLYLVITTPGTGGDQPSAYTVTVTDGDSKNVLALTARSTTATEYALGSETYGAFPPGYRCKTLSLGDLGNANTANVRLIFTK